MTHWGWHWIVKKKHLSRKLCSSMVSIDSFQLYKNNTIRGFVVQPMDVRLMPMADNLLVTYRNHKEHSYIIPIVKLSCNYGGYRYFFKCPLCKKRMRFLYFAEQSMFLCRRCLNLGYESQRLRPTVRYNYMSAKVKQLVKNKGGDIDCYQKPPHMHQRTYEMLRSKEHYFQSKSHEALNQELRSWYGIRTKKYLDGFFDYVDETKEWRKKRRS